MFRAVLLEKVQSFTNVDFKIDEIRKLWERQVAGI